MRDSYGVRILRYTEGTQNKERPIYHCTKTGSIDLLITTVRKHENPERFRACMTKPCRRNTRIRLGCPRVLIRIQHWLKLKSEQRGNEDV